MGSIPTGRNLTRACEGSRERWLRNSNQRMGQENRDRRPRALPVPRRTGRAANRPRPRARRRVRVLHASPTNKSRNAPRPSGDSMAARLAKTRGTGTRPKRSSNASSVASNLSGYRESIRSEGPVRLLGRLEPLGGGQGGCPRAAKTVDNQRYERLEAAQKGECACVR